MSLTLSFINGPREGESIYIEEAQSIGRNGDIPIHHPKVSGLHAFLKSEGDQQWVIEDNNSKNGVRVNGDKTAYSPLQKDDIIALGDIELRVVEVAVSWRPYLNQILIEARDYLKDAPLKVVQLRPVLVLKFVKGIQYQEQYLLEYAPRSFGGESQDIQLYENLCPDHAFEIHGENSNALFKTSYPELVKLNGSSVDSAILKKGDKIAIRKTLIEVDFINL